MSQIRRSAFESIRPGGYRVLALAASGLLLVWPGSAVAAAAPSVPAVSQAPLTVWSGTFTYSGHQDYSPVESGGYRDHFVVTESFTAQVSVQLNDLGPGDGAIGNLTGPAIGTETFDHTAESPDTDQDGNDCVRHDDTTYVGPRGGNIPDLAMTARYDGTYQLVTDINISDLGRMADHAVSGCGKDGTTVEHFYISFPGYQGTSGEQFVTGGTISTAGTEIKGSQRLTGILGWTATFTWDLHASCDGPAPRLRSTGARALALAAPQDTGGVCLPKAIPGPVQRVQRTGMLTLDASRSLPGSATAKIVRYDWEVIGTQDCKVDVQWATTTTSPTFGPFTALCNATVLLTITNDRGAQDTGRSSIVVTPRGAPFTTTPFTDLVDNGGKDTEALPPADTTLDEFYAGLNVAGCAPRFDRDNIFCPQAKDHVYRDVAYRLRTVNDPVAGPFQGYSYVSSTSLNAVVRGITNVSLTAAAALPKGAPMTAYAYNMKHNKDSYTQYLKLISQHENMGVAGKARSGHGQLIQKALQNGDPENNIRVWVERLIDKSDPDEQQRVEQAIVRANKSIDQAAADPLDLLGSPLIYLWNADDNGVFHWQAQTCQIGDVSICRDVPDTGTATPDAGAPGSQVGFQGGPFTPGEPVQGALHSVVLPLGTFTADGSGELDATFRVPVCAAPGKHEIVLTGTTSGKTVTIGFAVTGTPAASCGAAVPTGTPSSTTGTPNGRSATVGATSTVGPTAGAGRDLADTGTGGAGRLLLAMTFLAFGAGLLVLARRRSVPAPARHRR